MAGRQTEPRTHHVSKHYQKVKKKIREAACTVKHQTRNQNLGIVIKSPAK